MHALNEPHQWRLTRMVKKVGGGRVQAPRARGNAHRVHQTTPVEGVRCAEDNSLGIFQALVEVVHLESSHSPSNVVLFSSWANA